MQFDDIAIILTWPDATIRGDEQWMMFFKKIGLVKNLNFKVGHTGVVIIDRETGEMFFYDFGRYIAPRGYGRARSKYSDPMLDIPIKAQVNGSEIKNMEEIIVFLEGLKPAMYGEGKLFFSIVRGINFQTAKKYGDECVVQGTYPYGAVARNNNNCSRFITRMLMKSSPAFHFWHGINLPETIKSSPVSNLVNSSRERLIYSYTPEEGIKRFKMNRWQSFWFLIKQLGDNVRQNRADLLTSDHIIGAVRYNSKPITIPKSATYLGGVGDGAWYIVAYDANNKQFLIKRFTTAGKLEYVVLGKVPEKFDPNKSWVVTYDSHLLFTHVEQDGMKLKIEHEKQLSVEEHRFTDIKELYA
jgi:hypothetical protein